MYLKIIKMTTNNNLTFTTDMIWSRSQSFSAEQKQITSENKVFWGNTKVL